MEISFGRLPDGTQTKLYTISSHKLTARVTDFGATLVSLLVDGTDVVLGYDDCLGYLKGEAFLGATVGRNANRIFGAAFTLGNTQVALPKNEGENNLHSGPDFFHTRMWQVLDHSESAITLGLFSPHGDQGFPGNVNLRVRYAIEPADTLKITYYGISDQDTVLNLTNHSYFNLAGHDRGDLAMAQTLCMPARVFCPANEKSIPTGELLPVAGTPMDFRESKALGRDIGMDYAPLHLQNGYDHNFEVCANPCAVLTDPISGRRLEISTDCPGIQVYTANFTKGIGKGGAVYSPRCAVALETQYYPDAVHHPDWAQPIVKAGVPYESETCYRFI